MKAEKKLSIALAALMVAGALPVAVAADDTTEMVYGTMTIPYAEFYRGEGVDYDVDVVTSATASKWKNENLVGGTYSHEAEKGGVIDGFVHRDGQRSRGVQDRLRCRRRSDFLRGRGRVRGR